MALEARQSEIKPYVYIWIAVCCLLLIFDAAFMTPDFKSVNPASRLATVDSLVHRGTFAIDGSPFAYTLDKIRLGDHFYSEKSPLFSVLLAGVYWGFFHSTHINLAEHARGVSVMLVFFSGIVPIAFLLLATYHISIIFGFSAYARRVVFINMAFASLVTGYAARINNHTPAAALAFIAFYMAVRLKRGAEVPGNGQWFGCGLIAALAAIIDLGASFILAGIGVYLFCVDARKTVQFFAPPVIVMGLLHCALMYHLTGSFLPVNFNTALYNYPGSYWLHPGPMDALHEPKGVYLFNMTLGHHGLWSMTPMFFFSLIGFWRCIKTNYFRAEAIMALTCLIMLILFYMAVSSNYGGSCVGFRWLIVIMPLLFVFAGLGIEGRRSKAACWVVAAFSCIGFLNASNALYSAFHYSLWHKLFFL